MTEELKQYIMNHDYSEDEVNQLVEWVEAGNSIYSNPDGMTDGYGKEVPFMRWLFACQDPYHPLHNQTGCRHNRNLRRKTSEKLRILRLANRMMREELCMYRLFLARIPDGSIRYEQFRERMICRQLMSCCMYQTGTNSWER